MKMRFAACIALAAIYSTPAALAQPAAHWTCLDGSGKTVATDVSCPDGSTLLPEGARLKPSLATLQPKPDWRSRGIPVWIWPIVGVLGLTWLWFLLPEGLFRRRQARDGGQPQTPPTHVRLPPVVFVPPPRKAPVPQGRPAMVVPPPVAPPTPAPTPTPTPAAPLPGWTLDLIHGLSLNRLEALVQRFWQARGCEVQRAKNADGGIELLVSRPGATRLFALAQCGPTRSGAIGPASVKALVASALDKSASLVLLYGLSGFTEDAQAFAKDQPIKLVTAAGLLGEIGLLSPVEQQRLLERTLVESGP